MPRRSVKAASRPFLVTLAISVYMRYYNPLKHILASCTAHKWNAIVAIGDAKTGSSALASSSIIEAFLTVMTKGDYHSILQS